MFNKTPQRNFEWFEVTFSKKIQTIINDNKKDSLTWIRDLFVSLLITIFSLFCQFVDADNSPTLQIILQYSTVFSIVGLLGWFLFCIIRYNKKIKNIKNRIIPHSTKKSYSIDESVQLFDNDICNELILSKNYISLANSTTDEALKKFYFIEAIHYYFKSIRDFNNICTSASENFDELFCDKSGLARKINLYRLANYLELIKSVKIDRTDLSENLINDINNYFDSYSVVTQAFINTLSALTKKYSNLKYLSEKIIEI